jgi:hypothetical protein
MWGGTTEKTDITEKIKECRDGIKRDEESLE